MDAGPKSLRPLINNFTQGWNCRGGPLPPVHIYSCSFLSEIGLKLQSLGKISRQTTSNFVVDWV